MQTTASAELAKYSLQITVKALNTHISFIFSRYMSEFPGKISSNVSYSVGFLSLFFSLIYLLDSCPIRQGAGPVTEQANGTDLQV